MTLEDPKAIAPELTKDWIVERLLSGQWRIRRRPFEGLSLARIGLFLIGALVFIAAGVIWSTWTSGGSVWSTDGLDLIALVLAFPLGGGAIMAFVFLRQEGREWLVGKGSFESSGFLPGGRGSRVTQGRFVLDHGRSSAFDTLTLIDGKRVVESLASTSWTKEASEIRALAAFFSDVTGWPVDGAEMEPGFTPPSDRPSEPLDASVAKVALENNLTTLTIERTGSRCIVTVEDELSTVITGTAVLTVLGTLIGMAALCALAYRLPWHGLYDVSFSTPPRMALTTIGMATVLADLLWKALSQHRVRSVVLDRAEGVIRYKGRERGRLADVDCVQLVLIASKSIDESNCSTTYRYVVRFGTGRKRVELPCSCSVPAGLNEVTEHLAGFLGVPVVLSQEER